jgi:hypothetical protein
MIARRRKGPTLDESAPDCLPDRPYPTARRSVAALRAMAVTLVLPAAHVRTWRGHATRDDGFSARTLHIYPLSLQSCSCHDNRESGCNSRSVQWRECGPSYLRALPQVPYGDRFERRGDGELTRGVIQLQVPNATGTTAVGRWRAGHAGPCGRAARAGGACGWRGVRWRRRESRRERRHGRVRTTSLFGETITPSVSLCRYRRYALTIARVAPDFRILSIYD